MAVAHTRAECTGALYIERLTSYADKHSRFSLAIGNGVDIHLIVTRDELQELVSKGQAALQEDDIAEEALARR